MVVTTNLYGDVVSDITAQIAGSVGLAGSSNIGEHLAMFEAIHGSAPDIAGKGIANPMACMLSFAMALRYSFDAGDAADQLEGAVQSVLASGVRTADLMQADGQNPASTVEVGDAILAALDASA